MMDSGRDPSPPSSHRIPVPQTPSFRQIFDEQSSYVCTVIRRFGVPERDVEDVAHDAFVVVHRRLADYDPSLPIRPWLFGIAFRVAVAHRRRVSNRAQISEHVSDLPDSEPSVEQKLDAEAGRRLVLRALEALEPDRRAVFVLHELDGVPIPQVAAALEIVPNTAYSRLRVAREEFAAAVRRLKKGVVQ